LSLVTRHLLLVTRHRMVGKVTKNILVYAKKLNLLIATACYAVDKLLLNIC